MGNRTTSSIADHRFESAAVSTIRQLHLVHKLSSTERVLLIDIWQLIESRHLAIKTIADAWLLAFEMIPPALLELYGFDKPLHAIPDDCRYRSIIQQASHLLTDIITGNRCNATIVIDRAFALGIRHRNYIDFDNQSSYWRAFPIAFARVVGRQYDEELRVLADKEAKEEGGGDGNRSRGGRLNCLQSQSTEAMTTENAIVDKVNAIESAARHLMTNIVDAMQRGYNGGDVLPPPPPPFPTIRQRLSSHQLIGRMRLRYSKRSRSLDSHHRHHIATNRRIEYGHDADAIMSTFV